MAETRDYSNYTSHEALLDLLEALTTLGNVVGRDPEAAKALADIEDIVQKWLRPLAKQMPNWTPNGPPASAEDKD